MMTDVAVDVELMESDGITNWLPHIAATSRSIRVLSVTVTLTSSSALTACYAGCA